MTQGMTIKKPFWPSVNYRTQQRSVKPPADGAFLIACMRDFHRCISMPPRDIKCRGAKPSGQDKPKRKTRVCVSFFLVDSKGIEPSTVECL